MIESALIESGLVESALIERGANRKLASLPMYDMAELHAAHDALWQAIAVRLQARGIADVPAGLIRTDDLLSIWQDAELLLGQTCGYPLVTTLVDRVQLVATPVYSAPGCEGAQYRSAIVISAASRACGLDDLRGSVCAVNSFDSNSGMNILRAMIAPFAQGKYFFENVAVSGSHRQSLQMIASGSADIAAIDCVTLALLSRIEPQLIASTRVLGWSDLSPGLPLITSLRSDESTVAALRQVLSEIASDPTLAKVRADLLLSGFEFVSLHDYARVKSSETDAIALGYPRLS